jgi:hypothetical protein
MANDPQDATKAKAYRDWLSRQYREFTAAQKRRTELWQALNRYLNERGDSWVVSVPGPRVRIERRQGSNLAAALTKYAPTHCGTGERLIPDATVENFKDEAGHPVTRTYPGLIAVDILEIKLPER